MKVLLVNPPITYYKKEAEYSPYEPLGTMYLAAYLKKHSSCEIRLLDASSRIDIKRWEGDFFKIGYTDEMMVDKIKSFKPDIIGISSMYTINSKGTHDLAKLIKNIDQNIFVVVGGAHASAFPEWILKDENIDLLVIGEGEQTLLDIVEFKKNDRDIFSIKGIAFKSKGEILKNPSRDFIKNLDDIPFPGRDMVDMKVYLYEKYSYEHSMTPPRANIVSSRGCPYKCSFCSIHSLWRHSYRMRSPENVVDEIEELVQKFGVKEIAFFDDNVSLDKNRMKAICEEIIRRNIKIRWCTPNGIAIWTLDKDVLDKMRESGCYKLTFGIETASRDTQKFIRKEQINLDKAKEVIAYCNKLGIWTHSTFIIGFPYETEDDIKETIKFAVNSNLDMSTFFIATPYPGTELYEVCKKESLLPNLGNKSALEWLGDVGGSMCGTKNFTKEEIETYLKIAKRKVYIRRVISFFNPFNFVHKIWGKNEFKYFIKQITSYSRQILKLLSN